MSVHTKGIHKTPVVDAASLPAGWARLETRGGHWRHASGVLVFPAGVRFTAWGKDGRGGTTPLLSAKGVKRLFQSFEAAVAALEVS